LDYAKALEEDNLGNVLVREKKEDWFLNTDIYKKFINEWWSKYKGIRTSPHITFKYLLEHKDYEDVVGIMGESLKREAGYKEMQKAKGGFVADWPHMKTWIKERRWEQEFPEVEEVKESIL
jgi:hypothetical protein